MQVPSNWFHQGCGLNVFTVQVRVFPRYKTHPPKT
jgi:hypothetical protein